MKVWKKQTIRWTKNERTVPKGTRGSVKKVIESKRFYGSLKTASGKTKQQPLTEDEPSSLKLLNKLQNDEDKKRLLGITSDDEKQKTDILKAVDEYISFLEGKGNTAEHVTLKRQRLLKLIDGCGFGTVADLESGKVIRTLKKWTVSIQTKNHYTACVKSFSRWLWKNKYLKTDPMIDLEKQNAQTDRRRKRRPFTDGELNKLFEVTHNQPTYQGAGWRLSGPDRVILYRLAVSTGLRAKELCSLQVSDFDFKTNTLTVEASNTKNRKTSSLPLPVSIVEELKTWIGDRAGFLFSPIAAEKRRAGMALKRDIQKAGIETVDENGLVLDFHSLRYTFISNLAKGNVHPAKAQRLARHSDINLTMNVYTQLNIDDLREAVNVLPSF